ncbi:hypothetical protein [Roseateles sp.]|uniref:hypothetical protein n=1 Tax=Roseateles sp. TaxID=1971397 RepID=UPI0032650E4F
MANKEHPFSITALKSKAQVVRQVACEQGLAFDEEAVAGEDDALRFNFAPVDDVTSRKFLSSIPRGVYYFRAIVVGSSLPNDVAKVLGPPFSS